MTTAEDSPSAEVPQLEPVGDREGWRLFTPTYESSEPSLADLALLLSADDDARVAWIDGEIAALRRRAHPPLQYLTSLTLLRDLLHLGWSLRVEDGSLWVRPHAAVGLPDKDAVRRQLSHGRSDQLREPAVRSFIERMERPPRSGRARSVVSVIADGPALAARLRPARDLPRDSRAAALREACRPYLEVATHEAIDRAATGQPLLRLWRYFRYTWASRHRRPPGRHVAFLVRDAAQPGQPVMAITALSSTVLQLTPRDEWVGWTPSGLARLVSKGEVGDREALAALRARVLDDLASLYTEDLGFDASAPPVLDDALDRRLLSIAGGAAADRGEALARGEVDREVRFDVDSLRARTLSPLFRGKRAATARTLLRIHRELSRASTLDEAMRDAGGRDAVSLALRQVKQRFASASVMEVSTCGATPPYGPLLAGKLACLLMLTPFVREAVRAAYADEPSVIASQMAGRPIVKPPSLVMLATTSLYSARSSQYNRLRLPAGTLPDQPSDLAYLEVGRSQGHGATNLSAEAEALLAEVAASRREFRNVNFVFGEGQSPKLRELREATAALGLGAADILRHDSPRIAYVAPLVANARRVLLGVDPLPDAPSGGDGVEAVAEFWRARWLASRLDHAPALDAVAASPRSSLLVSREYEAEAATGWLDPSFRR